MPNRLSESTSPYLLQHAENPVDWYAWGEEAFAEAKRRDVPIFLSVGYSACHWCHVMAHESFEDEHIAALMNAAFVNVKVDREELPAVDALYMEATQAMTGHGGWPMSVWLDHDRRPWYAGTYFPATPGHGMPSFGQLIVALDEAWTNERDKVSITSTRIMDSIGQRNELAAASGDVVLREDISAAITSGVSSLAASFDPVHGGFGGAPKFPAPLALEFLMRVDAYNSLNELNEDPRIATMLETTFDQMARGGMYDQLRGGFARYSVDAMWTVPHFEKMLYDNAQLLSAYTNYYLLTQSPFAERIVRETAEFLLREMRTPQGGFASALDADSLDEHGHSHEGAFYAWSPAQLIEVLGRDDGQWAAQIFNVTAAGTFEKGLSVLSMWRNIEDHERFRDVCDRLRQVQDSRTRPGRDDKVVAAWNGLVIRALVRASEVFQVGEWLEAATQAADLLVSVHLGASPDAPAARLVRVSRDGHAGIHAPGTLEDQGLVASAFLALNQATGEHAWLEFAELLLNDIAEHFVELGQLTNSADDAPAIAEGMRHRGVDPTDSVTPSGWSAAVDAAMTYAALTANVKWSTWAEKFMSPLVTLTAKHARFAGWGAATLVAHLDGPREIAVACAHDSPWRTVASQSTAPGAVYAWESNHPLMADRQFDGITERGYVCRNFVCEAPTVELQEFKNQIGTRI